MRVALACDWFLPRLGGIELHLRDLAIALRAHGVDAAVVTTTPGAEVVDGVPVYRVKGLTIPGTGVVVDPRATREIRRLLRSEGFDAVHAHASVVSPTAYGAALAAAADGMPAVLTFHSMLMQSATILAGFDAVAGWSRNIMLSAVSSVVAAQLARGMPGADVNVLPNGVDVAFWKTSRPAPSGKEVHVVSAIRLSRKKRPERLLRAFARSVAFVAGAPSLRLTLAGDGPARAALERQANALGIRDRVAFAGHLSRPSLRSLYESADLFALPSERESFGIAALEARAAGLPVLGMLSTGLRDFTVHGRNGLLAKDEADFTSAMERLAADAPLRRHLAGWPSAPLADYDWPSVVAQHVRAYHLAAALGVSAATNSHT